jgi:hypothetical protein
VKKKKYEVTIERDEILVIRSPATEQTYWCSGCGKQVSMVTPDQAALISGASWRQVSGWIESASVHFVETPEGMVLICLDSLSQWIQGPDKTLAD